MNKVMELEEKMKEEASPSEFAEELTKAVDEAVAVMTPDITNKAMQSVKEEMTNIHTAVESMQYHNQIMSDSKSWGKGSRMCLSTPSEMTGRQAGRRSHPRWLRDLA